MATSELTANAIRAAARTRSTSISSSLAGWRASLPVRKYDKGQYPRGSDTDYMKRSFRGAMALSICPLARPVYLRTIYTKSCTRNCNFCAIDLSTSLAYCHSRTRLHVRAGKPVALRGRGARPIGALQRGRIAFRSPNRPAPHLFLKRSPRDFWFGKALPPILIPGFQFDAFRCRNSTLLDVLRFARHFVCGTPSPGALNPDI
jgi:hypothetical protein